MDILSLIALLTLSIFSAIYLASKLKEKWQKYTFLMIVSVVVFSTILGLFADVTYTNWIVIKAGYASISLGQICTWIATVILPFGSLAYPVNKAQGRGNKVLVGLIGIGVIMIFVVGLFDLTNRPIR